MPMSTRIASLSSINLNYSSLMLTRGYSMKVIPSQTLELAGGHRKG